MNVSLRQKLRELLLSFLLMFLSIIAVSLLPVFIGEIIREFKGIPLNDLVLQELEPLKTDTFWLIPLLVMPTIEEIVFRFPLRLRKYSIVVLILAVCGVLTMYFFSTVVVILACIFIFLVIRFQNYWEPRTLKFLKKHYGWFFYFLAITFALLHITNYSDAIPGNLMIWMPFYVLPQFVMALFLSYIRMKNGLFYSIILHYFINASYIIPAITNAIN